MSPLTLIEERSLDLLDLVDSLNCGAWGSDPKLGGRPRLREDVVLAPGSEKSVQSWSV